MPARLSLLAWTILLPSCLQSSSPLSDPDGVKADGRLGGAWKLVGAGAAEPDQPL
jgi:hypothetical protein